jgi:hypothetical protein
VQVRSTTPPIQLAVFRSIQVFYVPELGLMGQYSTVARGFGSFALACLLGPFPVYIVGKTNTSVSKQDRILPKKRTGQCNSWNGFSLYKQVKSCLINLFVIAYCRFICYVRGLISIKSRECRKYFLSLFSHRL